MFNSEAHTDAIDKMDKRCDVIEERMAELKYASAIGTNNIEQIKAKKDLATYNETIFDIANLALVRLEMLLSLSYKADIPEGGDIPAVCPLAEALIRDTRILLKEGNDYIEKEFGSVEIKRVCHGQIGFSPGQMLCVDFEPSVISPLGKKDKVDFPAERLNPGE